MRIQIQIGEKSFIFGIRVKVKVLSLPYGNFLYGFPRKLNMAVKFFCKGDKFSLAIDA